MNKELKFWLTFSRQLPRWKASTVLMNRIVIPFYNRKSRSSEVNDVLGAEMELRTTECVDASLLFFPHIYDSKEIDFLLTQVQKNWTFVDVGAHIGFYSLVLGKRITEGRIIALEADPGNAGRFKKNLTLNPSLKNIELVEGGVSDRMEVLSLGISTTGNTSGNSFLSGSSTRVDVPCRPLYDILVEKNCNKVDCMKIDIEGFEYRVFNHFLKSAPKSLWPKLILLEDNPTIVQEGNVIQLLLENGYQLSKDFGLNKVLKFSMGDV